MSTFTYCSYSKTIRQMPQNYLVAKWTESGWVYDADGAIKQDESRNARLRDVVESISWGAAREIVTALTQSDDAVTFWGKMNPYLKSFIRTLALITVFVVIGISCYYGFIVLQLVFAKYTGAVITFAACFGLLWYCVHVT